jgi:transposase InsO family protein
VKHGIDREHTIQASPEQNGIAERFNHTLLQGLSTMFSQSKLPHSLWPDAVEAFVHVYNRIPHSSNGFKPSVAHM